MYVSICIQNKELIDLKYFQQLLWQAFWTNIMQFIHAY